MPRIKTDNAGPNPVDVHIGAKLKSRRLILGLSQEELARAIGLTFQQIQKYERGANRISASRLVDICHVLKTPVDYFFEGSYGIGKLGAAKAAAKGFAEAGQEPMGDDPLGRRDVLELVRAYSKITSPQLRKQILEMAKAMAASEDSGENPD